MGNQQAVEKQGAPGQQPKQGFGYDAQVNSNKPVATNKIQLAVSPIGGVPGAQAYHSSVIVNGEEFSFSDGGITIARGTDSHDAMARQANSATQVQINTQVFDMGMSAYAASQLKASLERHFLPGTYDLLKKNCNTFSDCALFYLLKKRIDPRYRQLESIGARNPQLISQLSGNNYQPNPKVQDFDLENIIQEIDPDKVWAMKGEATGGAVADSREAMRAARLARLGGGSSSTAGASGTAGTANLASSAPAAGAA